VVDEGWQERLGPDIPITTSWQVYEYDYVPASEHLLRGFAVGFEDNATYWFDDLLAWDTTDYDAETGLSATYVQRLAELNLDLLRLGGLGVNGIPLQSCLRERWDLDYGPPDLQPDFDLNTFLRLCRRVGAQPFITVPPAFSDDTSWQQGDLTDHVIANVYVDHGNLVDYIGGDNGTTYGARREADGLGRWDLEFDAIYFEMGNELWGTPDDNWDMDPNENEPQDVQMQNYATYCDRRMTEMKGRPGWRGNMKVGFGGRSPTTWLGGWPGSYDGTLVPQIGDLTDFSTIDIYYGNGAATDSDDVIFGALFANAPKHEREIAEMKTAFAAANGGTDIETTVYEGNATWGGYEGDLSNPSPLYYKSVSLGAAVSLVDVYAAANRAGVTVNNHFHYGGNVWGATGGYPAVNRKPAFYALKLLTSYVHGDLRACTVSGGGSYDDPLTGETGVDYVACYPYRSGDVWYLLLVNRHRGESRQVEIARQLAPMTRISLHHADINANNETSETVTLVTEPLDGILVNPVTETLPAHSAMVLVLSETGELPTDAGPSGDDGGGADAGVDDGPAGDDGGDPAADGPGGGSGSGGACGCGRPGDAGGIWLAGLVLLLGWFLRRRHHRDTMETKS
jgi:hypothetical protein